MNKSHNQGIENAMDLLMISVVFAICLAIIASIELVTSIL